MNSLLPPADAAPVPVRPAPGPRASWGRHLVNVLVALVVVAVAAATFVFSYDGVHAVALLGGVSARLARYYPGLFDAVLVIACVAAAMLRERRWLARLWAWLVIIALLGAIGTADVLHAMGYSLRHRPTEGIVAGAPVVAVLLAFSLLLILLRPPRPRSRARAGRDEAARDPGAAPALALPPALAPGGPAATAAVAVVAAAAATGTREVPAFADGHGRAGTLPRSTPAALPAGRRAGDPVTGLTAEPAPVTPPDGLPVMRRVTASPAGGVTLAEPEAATPEAPGEAEPGTVEVPAAPETAVAAPAPAVAAAAVPARPGIRYAGGAAPTSAGWQSEGGAQYAGLVYSAQDDADSADEDRPGGPPENGEADEDAPSFATAPFAAIPRLNRVRSMPAPPADDNAGQ